MSRRSTTAAGRLALCGVLAGLSQCSASRIAEPPSLAAVAVSPSTSTIATALNQALDATAKYSNGRDSTVTTNAQWASSAPNVATVAGGMVTGVSVGTTQITASFGGMTGTAQVVVAATPPPLTGMNVSPSRVSLAVGDHEALAATGHYAGGATGSLTGQASWTSSAPGIASLSAGVITGVSVGNATITATVGAFQDTVQVSVTPTNEPAGFTELTEHYFNTVKNTDGAGSGLWHTSDPTPFTIVQDTAALRSPPNVAQFTYPAGFQAGSAPGHVDFDLPPGYSQVYLSLYMKLSSNFEGQSSETNKVLYLWINDDPAVFLSNQGSGTTTPLIPTVRYQGAFDSRAYFRQNIGMPLAMTRGQWRRWEVLLSANTPGQRDGVIRFWIDGQKVGEYTDVYFRDTTNAWQYLYLQPIWGGIGGSVTATQYLWVDHLYVSAAP
jgi:Bacterial Ig-like domain (group 2)